MCICTCIGEARCSPWPIPLLTAPIGKSLWRLAAPTTAVMVAQTFVAIAETFIFGRLGTEALAGFALVFPFMMMMTMMAAGGMGGGVAAAMARAVGGGRIEDARALVLHALVLGAALRAALHPARLDGGARRSTGCWAATARALDHAVDLQPRAVHRRAC